MSNIFTAVIWKSACSCESHRKHFWNNCFEKMHGKRPFVIIVIWHHLSISINFPFLAQEKGGNFCSASEWVVQSKAACLLKFLSRYKNKKEVLLLKGKKEIEKKKLLGTGHGFLNNVLWMYGASEYFHLVFIKCS